MATTVKFGTVAATAVTVKSPNEITCTVPAGTGTVDVIVTTDAGTDTLAGGFTYEAAKPAPAVDAVDPATGDEAGGDEATITGTNLGSG